MWWPSEREAGEGEQGGGIPHIPHRQPCHSNLHLHPPCATKDPRVQKEEPIKFLCARNPVVT